jgi:membrane protein DedA with SNARE-associated domain
MAWNGLLLLAGAFVARNAEQLLGLFLRYTVAAWAALVVGLAAAVAIRFWRRRGAR